MRLLLRLNLFPMLKMQSFLGNSGRVAHLGSLSWNSRNPDPWVRTRPAQSTGTVALGALFSSVPTTQVVLLGQSLDPPKPLPPHAQWRESLICSPHAVILGSNKKNHTEMSLVVQWCDSTLQCRVCEFHPWSGSWNPTCLVTENPNIKNGPHQKRKILTTTTHTDT